MIADRLTAVGVVNDNGITVQLGRHGLARQHSGDGSISHARGPEHTGVMSIGKLVRFVAGLTCGPIGGG